jgi:hypothetical protein
LLFSTAEDETFLNPDQALKLADEALRLDTKDAYAVNAKSCALAARGDYEAAIALQESITDPDWLNDEGIDGGVRAKERLAAWKTKKLWHP